MSRGPVVVRVGRMIQGIPMGWMRSLETPVVYSQASARPKVIFLLALPRSGSTLTYQAITHAFRCIYLSNLWNLLYQTPGIGGWLSTAGCSNYQSDFRSDCGFVGGLSGPAEGLQFWSQWTGAELDETAMQAQENASLKWRIEYIKKVLGGLSSCQRPMVSGFIGHILMAKALREWFPEAVFVRLHRDPLSNALSLLRCRSERSWFSVFPAECAPEVGKGVYREVAAQVYFLNQRLMMLENDERTVHIHYEKLCENPEKVINQIQKSCKKWGLDLRQRNTLPREFQYKLAAPAESEDSMLIMRELQKLQNEHGPLGISW